MNQPPLLVDNTTLISFALVGHLALLPVILGGRGRICATVEGEATGHANYHSADARLQPMLTVGQLLAVDSPTPDELARTTSLRRLLASPGEGTLKHLGEAETLAIIELRYSKAAVVVTDDDSATRLARNLGIKPATTLSLLKQAYNTQVLTDVELQTALTTLHKEGRKAPPPMTSLGQVRQWAEPL